MTLPPCGALRRRHGSERRGRRQVAAAQASLADAVLSFLGRTSSAAKPESNASPAAAARRQLLDELRLAAPDVARLGACVDQLVACRVPLRDADLGGGPFHVVYTRGPLLWALWTSQARHDGRATRPADNQAWQDFDPARGVVRNGGELVGGAVTVEASGTFRAADPGQRACPKRILASIERGSLTAWGRTLPLPIRGEGEVEVAYCDRELRVFRATNGSLSLQVRRDRLQPLLGWPR